MKSGLARRILFLVDRRALAAQAAGAMALFQPESAPKFRPVESSLGLRSPACVKTLTTSAKWDTLNLSV
jgi:type I site-specific restriction endonuclease